MEKYTHLEFFFCHECGARILHEIGFIVNEEKTSAKLVKECLKCKRKVVENENEPT